MPCSMICKEDEERLPRNSRDVFGLALAVTRKMYVNVAHYARQIYHFDIMMMALRAVTEGLPYGIASAILDG